MYLDERTPPFRYSSVFIPYYAFPGKIAILNKFPPLDMESFDITEDPINIRFRRVTSPLNEYIMGTVVSMMYSNKPNKVIFMEYPLSMKSSAAKSELEKYIAKAEKDKQDREVYDKPWLDKIAQIDLDSEGGYELLNELCLEYYESRQQGLAEYYGYYGDRYYYNSFSEYTDFYANGFAIVSIKTGEALTAEDIFKNDSWQEKLVKEVTEFRYSEHYFSEQKAWNSLDKLRIGYIDDRFVFTFDDSGDLGKFAFEIPLREIGLENLKF